MKCHYPYTGDGCDQQATTILIHGCLNQHVHDIPLCDEHHQQWCRHQRSRSWRCVLCAQPIDQWDTTPITPRIAATYKPPNWLMPLNK